MVDSNAELVPFSLTQPAAFGDAARDGHHQAHYWSDRDSVSAEYRLLLTGLEVILSEAASRIETAPGDWLPGFSEVVEAVVVYATTTKRPVYGWYCANAWHDTRSGQRFAEIVLNADALDRPAESVMSTLVHELVHAYAAAIGVKDTSRRGDYHNGVFADLAMKAGLAVRRHTTRGHVTTGISPLGYSAYGDLIRPLETLLRLHRDHGPDDDPDPVGASGTAGGPTGPQDEEPRQPKYVMASCACATERGRPVVIRVARGSWTPDTIWCRRCGHSFIGAEERLSESPQRRVA